jgi:uncharacterized protein
MAEIGSCPQCAPSRAGMSADVVAPLLSVEIDQRQQLLEITDVVTRLENILELLKADQQAA